MSDILVVTSKIKKRIKDNGDMNTSASAALALTKIVEFYCDKAIENARKDKRKTVMDRDFTLPSA